MDELGLKSDGTVNKGQTSVSTEGKTFEEAIISQENNADGNENSKIDNSNSNVKSVLNENLAPNAMKGDTNPEKQVNFKGAKASRHNSDDGNSQHDDSEANASEANEFKSADTVHKDNSVHSEQSTREATEEARPAHNEDLDVRVSQALPVHACTA